MAVVLKSEAVFCWCQDMLQEMASPERRNMN